MLSSSLGEAGPDQKKWEVSIKPDLVSQTKFVTVSRTSQHPALIFNHCCYQLLNFNVLPRPLGIILVLAVTTSPYSWCKVFYYH
jgi:hypothetical protein